MAKYRKLGRTSSQRKALLRNQVTALLFNGKIVTTEAAASERLLKASATTETEFAISPAKSLKENKKRLKQIPVIPQRIPY